MIQTTALRSGIIGRSGMQSPYPLLPKNYQLQMTTSFGASLGFADDHAVEFSSQLATVLMAEAQMVAEVSYMLKITESAEG